MDDTSRHNEPKKERDVFYYRQRLKNRVFGKIAAFLADEFERTGLTKKDIAVLLKKDPAQISRWLSGPSNLTLETISDLLLAVNAELETPKIIRFSEYAKPNYSHPLIQKILAQSTNAELSKKSIISPPEKSNKIIAKIEQPEDQVPISLSW